MPRPGRPLLTIGYSTLTTRIDSISLPAHEPDVEILIAVQDDPSTESNPSGLPARLFEDRDDVELVRADGLGVARSRNTVLGRAAGRYLVFGDDDATFHIDGLREVIAAMEAEPALVLVQAIAHDESGHPRKRYPRNPCRLSRWNSAKVGTIELVVRTADVARASVRFDERFGAGSRNFLGDEFIFVTDALKAGLRCRFLPIPIAEHPRTSSGSSYGTQEDARVRSEVFGRVFGWWAPVGRLAFVARQPRRFRSLALTARFVLGRFDTDGHGPETAITTS